jgi:nitroreductase
MAATAIRLRGPDPGAIEVRHRGDLLHLDIAATEEQTMETLDAIRGRKSIRAFLPQPVPKALIAQVLEAGRWAPSGVNRQQWRVTVATGERLEVLREALVQRAREREPRAPSYGGTLPEVRRRTEGLVADLGRLAERLGKPLWEFVVLGSYRLYDAPVAVVVSHAGGSSGNVPPFVTTMLLAAHDLGLGTCWLGYPLSERDLWHQFLEIPQEETISAIVALGYPDPDSPANAYRSPRDDLDAFVRWVGFDEE